MPGPAMCMFGGGGPRDQTRRPINHPLPKEITGDEEIGPYTGGKYVLDYAGTFASSYEWSPDV